MLYLFLVLPYKNLMVDKSKTTDWITWTRRIHIEVEEVKKRVFDIVPDVQDEE